MPEPCDRFVRPLLPVHLWRMLTLGFAGSMLTACASLDARTTEYVGAPHASPTLAESVQVLRSEPTRPHVRLGEIVLDASVEPPPPVNEIEQKLKVEAAKIGGEAVVVVVVYDRIQPVSAYVSGPLWDRDIQTIDGRKLKGIVIRYQ